jgi:chemotaxis protein CheD
MAIKAVGIGEIMVSKNREDILKSFSLSSCIAVVMFDKSGIGGMVHVALPDSSQDSDYQKKPAAYYADKALPLLITRMHEHGAAMNKIWIKIAGASDSRYEKDLFNIGKRNILAVKKFLWKQGLGIIAEDTGGMIIRTVELNVNDGSLAVLSDGEKRPL